MISLRYCTYFGPVAYIKWASLPGKIQNMNDLTTRTINNLITKQVAISDSHCIFVISSGTHQSLSSLTATFLRSSFLRASSSSRSLSRCSCSKRHFFIDSGSSRRKGFDEGTGDLNFYKLVKNCRIKYSRDPKYRLVEYSVVYAVS